MCGIAGFVTRGKPDPELLRQMCDVLHHRGPDEDGYLIDPPAALGMRRLAIIDLATGRQPIFNENGSIAVVFNGEIYNFLELRRSLEARGHRFGTGSDTECIVHLYEEHGDRCVEHLRGMFAFALWDRKRRRLLLARDRVGKKPLYYRVGEEGIAFASELKALLEDRSFSRYVDLVALHHYLTYQYVPAPFSIFQGVRKLLPGHTLSYEEGRVSSRRYWKLSYEDKVSLCEREALERLQQLIHEATKIRLLSERPVGVFLSGGVDSSVVAAAMAQHCSEPIKTFSIGFPDERFDELGFARKVARHLGSDHHELVVTPSALEILPTLTWHYDEPFADSSAIPSYYVAQMASEHVTVALNGDGGDELFAGYHRYLANHLLARVRAPRALETAVARAVGTLPAGDRRSLAHRARRLLEHLPQPPEERYARWISYFDNEQKRRLYRKEMLEMVQEIDSYDVVRGAFAASDARDLIDRTLNVDVETYLPGDLLTKMDIATMANSLEARSPLLDHVLMEFAASLPSRMKVRRFKTKYLLKKAAGGWLPEDVLNRSKMGFGVPLADWLRGELRELAYDTLLDETAQQRGYFDPPAVRRLLDEHAAGVDHSPRIWALLQLELWHRMFYDRRPRAPRAPSARSLAKTAEAARR